MTRVILSHVVNLARAHLFLPSSRRSLLHFLPFSAGIPSDRRLHIPEFVFDSVLGFALGFAPQECSGRCRTSAWQL